MILENIESGQRSFSTVVSPSPDVSPDPPTGSTPDSFSGIPFLRIPDPTSLEEVRVSPHVAHWDDAMKKEMQALHEHNTWSLVPKPVDRRALGVKWVFKTKYLPSGRVEKFKARLVALGYLQKEGVDFRETYAPVAHMTSMRLIIGVASSLGLVLEQLDVDSAFLNGFIDAEVYLKQPPGFVNPKYPDHVYRLLKSLYGLKQAGRIWFHAACAAIRELGLLPTNADSCVFIAYWKDEGWIIVGIHVDDFILAGTILSLARFKDGMSRIFKVKLIGRAHWLLGIHIKYTDNSVSLSQDA